MMFRLIAALALAIFAAGPAVGQNGGEFRPTNGLGTFWMVTIAGLFGVLFPNLADDWVEFGDGKLVRIISALFLAIGATMLAEHYLNLDLDSIAFR